ncbi:slyX like protein [Aggregatibacter actinomycetemcomitans serotype e str. SC1083]|uniref:Protein SlyX homolog n=2 Tax=Aggregatibacter actinomycetemcomitans TaxID=714 RepID=G4A9H1_AGGAC|nr:slyX like protein [Aggregatibacter actinomycetemcomitans serotype e str. SC1083]
MNRVKRIQQIHNSYLGNIMSIQQNLAQRITELEMKTTFQETVIEELNQALVEQQFILDKIQLQLRYLANKIQNIQPSNIASQAEETPPPHY